MKIPKLTLHPTTRTQELYDRAMEKPEDQRNWVDRSYITNYGPKLAAHAESAHPTVLVREYQDSHTMQKDIAQLLGEGWQIRSQSAATPEKGALRRLAGGFVFLNREPVTTVVFSRPAAAAAQ
jgi:hypothetical protein